MLLDRLRRLSLHLARPSYSGDFLRVWHKNVSFLHDQKFMDAYRRGMDSGHKIGRDAGSRADIHIEWRIHTLCWAAVHAAQLQGDFVECGVNTGIFSLAIAQYIDFNRTGKHFYLFDTFDGIPTEQINDREHALNREEENRLNYDECYELAKRNFAPYPNAHLIRGKVPDTLDGAGIEKVCFLSIDMNIAYPEIAALKYFWDKLVPGAPVIFDDYGWISHVAQKDAIDAFAHSVHCRVLNLPTGQGLLLKPPT